MQRRYRRPSASALVLLPVLMEPMEVPDWGGGPAPSYPGLPADTHVSGTSKTVRRRHQKQALALDRLLHGVVTLRSQAAPAAPGIVAGTSC